VNNSLAKDIYDDDDDDNASNAAFQKAFQHSA